MSNCCNPANCASTPFMQPFVRPARDSYGACVCPQPFPGPPKPPGPVPPKPAPPAVPTTGPFIGNGFSLLNTAPYIIDTTMFRYGQILSYSESVRTHVARRTDPSCINISATFDMTDANNLTNTVLQDYLEKYISMGYATLQGVLPILKSTVMFKLYYTVTDYDGGIMTTGSVVTSTNDIRFHFTDIKDMYVTSARGMMIKDIPAMTYSGIYTLTFDRMEVYIPYINTLDYVEAGLNPFYQFVDSNLRIALQHDTIESTEPADWLLISEIPVNTSIQYTANITNRLRVSFTAFMNNVIAVPNTNDIWDALNEPTEEIVTQLRQEVSTLQETCFLLQQRLDEEIAAREQLAGQVELNKNNIVSHDRKIQHLESLVASYDSTFSALEARIYALEQRPLALVTYVEGKEFKTSQLTWKSYGQLYQCAKAFTASGDFNKDVGLGNLVPIAADATDISGIEAELREVVETANDASSTATATAETVDAMSGAVLELQEQTSTLNDQVSTINGTLETVESDINTLQDDVNDLKFDKDSKTKVIITNTTTGERQLANSYGAAATIVKNAEDGSFTITCGEEYSQQTIAADTFKDATRLTEITFPASITTIASTAFDGCDGIIINIPKETDSVTGSPWGATNATVNWNE